MIEGIYRNTNNLFAHVYVHNFQTMLERVIHYGTTRAFQVDQIGDASFTLCPKKVLELLAESNLRDKIDVSAIIDIINEGKGCDGDYEDEDEDCEDEKMQKFNYDEVYFSHTASFFWEGSNVKMKLEITAEFIPDPYRDEYRVAPKVIFSHVFAVPKAKTCIEGFFEDWYNWLQGHKATNIALHEAESCIGVSGITSIIRDILAEVKEKFDYIWFYNLLIRNGCIKGDEKPFIFTLRLPWYYAYYHAEKVFKGRDVIIGLDSCLGELRVEGRAEINLVAAESFKGEKFLFIPRNEGADFMFNCIWHHKYKTWVPFDARYIRIIKEVAEYKEVPENFIYGIGTKLLPLLYASIFYEAEHRQSIMKDAYMLVKRLLKNENEKIPFEKIVLLGALSGDKVIEPSPYHEFFKDFILKLPEIEG